MPDADNVVVLRIPQKWRLRKGAAVGSKQGGLKTGPCMERLLMGGAPGGSE